MIKELMQHHLDNLAKPVGSLGRLEQLALQMADIQQRVPPLRGRKEVFVFAGDHGINEEGVSMYPQAVTRQMVNTFLAGHAGINVIARTCGCSITVIDAGIANDINHEGIITRKAGRGTENFRHTRAMGREALEASLSFGEETAGEAVSRECVITALGDMGISNTSSAAALAVASGCDEQLIIDRGTGISDKQLEHKRRVILESVSRHAPYTGPYDVMEKLGGFELAQMTGFILGLRGTGTACVIDGFPVTSAAYMAWLIDPSVREFLFAGHQSKVTGHRVLLDAMGLEPLVDLGMRLGEGTGAVIGAFLLDLSMAIAADMASFDDAKVTRSNGEEISY